VDKPLDTTKLKNSVAVLP